MRVWRAVAALTVLAGLYVWARPVSVFNGYLYLRSWLQGAQGSSVLVKGYRIHYNVVGPKAGPPVVLVHGLGGHGEDYLNLLPYLVKAGCRVYTPDLPGFGRSERPMDFSYSIPAQAAVVVGFLDAMGLKQVDLGGWSMGGWIVQRIAAEHPERVRRLIIMDSAGLAETPAWNTGLLTPTTPDEVEQLEALMMPYPYKIPGFIARDFLRITKQRSWIIQRGLKTMLTGQDATDSALPRLRMPVLIVWGTKDRMFPLRQGEKMQQLIPGSRLERIEGCGHLAPGQCSRQVGPKLAEFVKR